MNQKNKTTDDKFYNEIVKYLGAGRQLNVKEIYDKFNEINQKTVSWRLHILVQQGKLFKAGYGYYSLNNPKEHTSLGYDYLQKTSKAIFDIAVNYGYKFYISGLDALTGEMLHVPEQFPVLLVAEEMAFDDLSEAFSDKGYLVLTEKNRAVLKDKTFRKKADVFMLKGKDFSMAINGMASKEKGFVDLYYAMTRFEYIVSVLELSRIYKSMMRNEAVTVFKMKKAAKDRGIENEIEWLLDLEKIPKKAKEFMKIQLGETE